LGGGNAVAHLSRLQHQSEKSKALPHNFNTLTIPTRQSEFPFHAEPKQAEDLYRAHESEGGPADTVLGPVDQSGAGNEKGPDNASGYRGLF